MEELLGPAFAFCLAWDLPTARAWTLLLGMTWLLMAGAAAITPANPDPEPSRELGRTGCTWALLFYGLLAGTVLAMVRWFVLSR